jgi:hypothetical protein
MYVLWYYDYESEVCAMLVLNATDVRKEWSLVIDSVIREKPKFIKRTRDTLFLTDLSVLESLLSAYSFTADKYIEEDGSVTLSLIEFDLVENGENEPEALRKLAAAILEYAEDYYDDSAFWVRGARKAHLPYVFKALILNDVEKIGGLIECRLGEI